MTHTTPPARDAHETLNTASRRSPISEHGAGSVYKTVLVQVEPGNDAAARLRVAVELAREFSAWLIGVFARSSDTWPDPLGISPRAMRATIAEDMRRTESLFRSATRSLAGRAAWRVVDDSANTALAQQSFAADLIIPNATAAGSHQMIAHARSLAAGVGPPVLWIPPRLQGAGVRGVVVGWKNTKGSYRALADAMPFLRRAETVHIVRVASEAEVSSAEDELAQVVERMCRHQLKAEGQLRIGRRASIAEALVDVAYSVSAELIVIGAGSRSRLRRWTSGSVTQDLLSNSPKLVLLSG